MQGYTLGSEDVLGGARLERVLVGAGERHIKHISIALYTYIGLINALREVDYSVVLS